jgi:hypothetical protein
MAGTVWLWELAAITSAGDKARSSAKVCRIGWFSAR